MTVPDEVTVAKFTALFAGFPDAYGTGTGGWVHSTPTAREFSAHLRGVGSGLGIGPLLRDGTCRFAAIDLDRPDFTLAKELMKLLPGTSWLERSRSGNAHVLVFFKKPIEAWVPRGIMREACAAMGERTIEVFPKTDRLLPGMVGNYLNLPYFGTTRPVIAWKDDDGMQVNKFAAELPVDAFVRMACMTRNDPDEWRARARWLGVPSPDEREAARSHEFGTQPNLHMCAQYVLENRDSNTVRAGHRAVVYFSLSKMFANWSQCDDDEALLWLSLINDASPDPIDMREMERIYHNAKRGGFTSTGCDDPLFQPYAHPDCPIAGGAKKIHKVQP